MTPSYRHSRTPDDGIDDPSRCGAQRQDSCQRGAPRRGAQGDGEVERPRVDEFVCHPIPGFLEDRGAEDFDACLRRPPCVEGKPGLAAGVREECLPVPALLRCHLREEQARAAAVSHHDPVHPDDDVPDVGDAARMARARRSRSVTRGHSVGGERREPRIVERAGDRDLLDRLAGAAGRR